MQRNLNQSISGRMVLDIPASGVLGSTVPASGQDGPSYLYNDVQTNSLLTSEVRGRIVSTTLPAGSWYAWNDGRFQTTGVIPDGSYLVVYNLFVYGVSYGNSNIFVTVGVGSVAPSITAHPSNASVQAPGTVAFNVTSSGSTPLAYQWQRKVGAGTFSNISGATSASYTTPATTLSGGTANNTDQYRVVVSNGAGSVTSNPATLTVTIGNVNPINTSFAVAQSPATPYSIPTGGSIHLGFVPILLPIANFIGVPLLGSIPFTTTFTDQSTNTPTGWSWTFGDGGTSTVQNPTHAYTLPGTYTVTLTASNSAGSSVPVSKVGYITANDTTVPTLTGTVTISAITSTGYTILIPVATDNVGVTQYRWRVNAGAWTVIPAGGRGTAITGRTPGTTDTLEVAAGDAAGNWSTNLTTPVTLSAGVSTPGVLPSFTVTSAVGGTNTPFSLGHAFKQGDVPAGYYITSSQPNFQSVVKNTWPDGSAKFAILSGNMPMVANTPVSIALATTTGAPAGVALTTTDLKTTGVTAAVDCGVFGTVSWSNTDWDIPFQTWVSGPKMSSWVYRKPVGTDPHLVAWLEVKLYSSGDVEVLPWIENGYLNVAAPTNKNATYTFTLGGTQRFSAVIDLKHHQRTVLISGTYLSHWLGTDPSVILKHDSKYLMSSELVPTYGIAVSPSDSNVTNLASTFVPLQQGDFQYSLDTMNSTGYASPIGLLPQHDAMYLASSAPSIYASVIRNGYSSGRYPINYRDETTNRPLRFSSYPNTCIAPTLSGMTDSGASSTNTYLPTSTGGTGPQWDGSHHPSVGYLAYLITGYFYFMEQVQFAATANYINITDTYREFSNGVFDEYRLQTRNAGWNIRTLAQAFTVTSDTDTLLRSEFLASFEANINHFHTRYIAQPHNPFGLLANTDYGGFPFTRASIWMNDFCVAAFGYAKSLNIPISTLAAAKFTTFYNWHAGSVVNRLGLSSGYWYINACTYTMAYSPSTTVDWLGGTGPWYSDWAAIYNATMSTIYAGQPWVTNTREGVLFGYDWANPTGYWGNLQPAISYAVRHGVTGAAAAYNRLVTASNYVELVYGTPTGLTGFKSNPVWAVTPAEAYIPRPTWFVNATLNQWHEIPNTAVTNYSTTVGGAVGNGIMDDYSGIVLKDDDATIISRGGGHAGYSGNEVLGLRLTDNIPVWTTIAEPTPLGLRISGNVWEGNAPDQRPNATHTYDSGQWSPAMNSVLWFSMRSPWNFSGTPIGGDRLFSLNWGTKTWNQPGSVLDIAALGSTATARDGQGNFYTTGVQQIYEYSPNGTFTTLTNNAILNWSTFGCLVYNSRNQSLFRIGDYGTAKYILTNIATATPSDVGSSLNGNSTDISNLNALTAIDTVGACYDPVNDRYVIPTGSGGSFYAIDGTSYAVTLVSPPTTSSSSTTVTNKPSISVGIYGRVKWSSALGGIIYIPKASSNVWFLRII